MLNWLTWGQLYCFQECLDVLGHPSGLLTASLGWLANVFTDLFMLIDHIDTDYDLRELFLFDHLDESLVQTYL